MFYSEFPLYTAFPINLDKIPEISIHRNGTFMSAMTYIRMSCVSWFLYSEFTSALNEYCS